MAWVEGDARFVLTAFALFASTIAGAGLAIFAFFRLAAIKATTRKRETKSAFAGFSFGTSTIFGAGFAVFAILGFTDFVFAFGCGDACAFVVALFAGLAGAVSGTGLAVFGLAFACAVAATAGAGLTDTGAAYDGLAGKVGGACLGSVCKGTPTERTEGSFVAFGSVFAVAIFGALADACPGVLGEFAGAAMFVIAYTLLRTAAHAGCAYDVVSGFDVIAVAGAVAHFVWVTDATWFPYAKACPCTAEMGTNRALGGGVALEVGIAVCRRLAAFTDLSGVCWQREQQCGEERDENGESMGDGVGAYCGWYVDAHGFVS